MATGVSNLLKFLATIFIAGGFALPVMAIDKDDLIDTNRPSFCQSALIVPKGTLQLENGSQYQKLMSGADYFDIAETECRLGLLKQTELQMFVPQWVLFSRGRGSYDGASGLGEVGIKQQIFDRKHFILSCVGAVNVPTGAKKVSGTACQGVLRLPYTVPINEHWSICGMQSLLLLNSGGDLQWQPFVMVTRTLGGKAYAFAEYAGFYTQNSHKPAQQIAHFGGVYKIKKNHQLFETDKLNPKFFPLSLSKSPAVEIPSSTGNPDFAKCTSKSPEIWF